MALKIVEFFGYAPNDPSPQAAQARAERLCPFVGGRCTKLLSDHEPSGACTVQQAHSGPIICCPNRVYAENYRVLSDIATEVFGEDVRLVSGGHLEWMMGDGHDVVVYGRRWGKELKLPAVDGRGGFFVDWILARVDADCELQEFVAVEVQTIDTTGNYREQREAYLQGDGEYEHSKKAGMNWENVSKRILPQIIYKGHVLRRERRCTKGLFFVCPTLVAQRVRTRLGNDLLNYPNLQPGSVTFRWYDMGPIEAPGQLASLNFEGQLSTTIDQVAVAFTAPRNLPPPNVYEQAIQTALFR